MLRPLRSSPDAVDGGLLRLRRRHRRLRRVQLAAGAGPAPIRGRRAPGTAPSVLGRAVRSLETDAYGAANAVEASGGGFRRGCSQADKPPVPRLPTRMRCGTHHRDRSPPAERAGDSERRLVLVYPGRAERLNHTTKTQGHPPSGFGRVVRVVPNLHRRRSGAELVRGGRGQASVRRLPLVPLEACRARGILGFLRTLKSLDGGFALRSREVAPRAGGFTLRGPGGCELPSSACTSGPRRKSARET